MSDPKEITPMHVARFAALLNALYADGHGALRIVCETETGKAADYRQMDLAVIDTETGAFVVGHDGEPDDQHECVLVIRQP